TINLCINENNCNNYNNNKEKFEELSGLLGYALINSYTYEELYGNPLWYEKITYAN
ncbi:20116_t:CDS:1, partial [Gigaspora margarita]